MADQVFTPSDVACSLVRLFRPRHNECVGDFAAGDGELLRAVARKWPCAEIVATDIDASLVRGLRSGEPTWHVGRCDFLSEVSRRRCKALRNRLGRFSLIVLNPPFGCRGAGSHRVVVGGHEVKCSHAMAFVAEALNFLARDGRIAAILPSGCVDAEKDAEIWAMVKEKFRVRIVGTLERKAFAEGTARAVLMHLLPSSGRPITAAVTAVSKATVAKVALIRGSVPMHVATNGLAGPGFRLVHTTDLHGDRLLETQHSVREERRFVIGPAVLIPRVGEPNADKCVLYLKREKLVLSDCIYAIRCPSTEVALRVRERLVKDWAMVQRFYGGTCARYITIARLRTVLASMGIVAS